jgi:hypothetical protein
MLFRATLGSAFVLLSLLLAGCGGKVDLQQGDALAGDGAGPGMLYTYDSPSPDLAPFTRDYGGLAKYDDPTQFQGIPGGPAAGPFQTCCLYSWAPASDLFDAAHLVLLRLTLNWTNTQQDQANLDLAVCVPWFCGFPEMPDDTNQLGPHTETFDLMSSGARDEFEGWTGDGVPQVGARYSNGVFTAGVPFTVHVEVVPVGDALAFLDPYEVVVPANSTLQAELVGPFRGTDLFAGLMVYGDAGLPIAYHALEGDDGSLHDLGHGEGSYVVAAFGYGGAVARLKVNTTTEPPALRPLPEAFSTIVVAAVTDPAEKTGTFTFEAPAGSLDTFPFFLADAGAQVANGPTTQSTITLTSSSGLVADVTGSLVGAATPQGQVCFSCSTSVDWRPENYVDDDGTYQVEYNTKGATGRFVLFTATYDRS